jgi:6-phosphogluconolactonase
MTCSFVYVSAAQAGTIDIFALDEAGLLKPSGSCPAGAMVMPLAVSPDRRRLHAAVRSEPFRLLTFTIAPGTGLLSEIASAPLPASMPAIAMLGDRHLLAASYGSDLLALLQADEDGAFRSPATQVLTTGRNAHMALADRSGAHVFVPCLGSDAIWRFRLDRAAGQLQSLEPTAALPAGFGPRHAVMSPDNAMLFVLGEFSGSVAAFRHDAATGALTPAGETSILPPGSSLVPGSPRPAAGGTETDRSRAVWCADIRITPDGRFLFATERTDSTIATLSLAAGSGKPVANAHIATETQPRGIAVDPSGRFLVASGERSDRIASYAIDPVDGRLTPVSRAPVSAGANWVEIVPAADSP